MSRGAPLTILDDRTPLTATQIDVARRIAWTVRMVRLRSPVNGRTLTLDEVARALSVSTTRVHRLETGLVRDGALIDSYEDLLGRPPGSLRAPVDILARTFPGASPSDRAPASRLSTVSEVSAATDRVRDHEPTSGDWLVWARAMARPGNIGMPEDLMSSALLRLCSELGRSVGDAYAGRYEALAVLRCSDYGHLVLEVARGFVSDPHVQVLNDLASAVGERVSGDAVEWMLELLDESRSTLVAAGAIGLENLAAISEDADFWRPLLPRLLEQFDRSEHDSAAWHSVSHLIRLVPRPVLEDVGLRPGRSLAPLAGAGSTGSVSPQQWTDCQRVASAVTGALALPEQPMLTRLVHDMVYSPFETHGVTSYFLLGAVPGLAEPLADELVRLVELETDPVIAARAARRLTGSQLGVLPHTVAAWLTSPSPSLRTTALRLAAHSDCRLDPDVLQDAIVGQEQTQRAALYAAGMLGHDVLDEWVDDANEVVAGAARWWLAHGARVRS